MDDKNRDVLYLVDRPDGNRIIQLEMDNGQLVRLRCLMGDKIAPNETVVAMGDKYTGDTDGFLANVYQITADATGTSFDVKSAQVAYEEGPRHFYTLTKDLVKSLLEDVGFKKIGALMQMHVSELPFMLPNSKKREEELRSAAMAVDSIMVEVAARRNPHARGRKPSL